MSSPPKKKENPAGALACTEAGHEPADVDEQLAVGHEEEEVGHGEDAAQPDHGAVPAEAADQQAGDLAAAQSAWKKIRKVMTECDQLFKMRRCFLVTKMLIY